MYNFANNKENKRSIINQDIKNINKIAEIQEDVNAIKIDMKKNINKMVESVEIILQ